MKPSSITYLSFLLLTNLPLLAFSFPEIVKDAWGGQIFSGFKYNRAAFNIPANGGGLRLARTGNSTCPVTVLQEYSYIPRTLPPMHFDIPDISIGIVFTGTPLVVDFRDVKPKCASSATLGVFEDKKLGISYVGLGGPKTTHPGEKMIANGTFNFQRFGKGYKFVFCVNKVQNCMDIGRYENHEGGRRLVLTKYDPFELQILRLAEGSGH